MTPPPSSPPPPPPPFVVFLFSFFSFAAGGGGFWKVGKVGRDGDVPRHHLRSVPVAIVPVALVVEYRDAEPPVQQQLDDVRPYEPEPAGHEDPLAPARGAHPQVLLRREARAAVHGGDAGGDGGAAGAGAEDLEGGDRDEAEDRGEQRRREAEDAGAAQPEVPREGGVAD